MSDIYEFWKPIRYLIGHPWHKSNILMKKNCFVMLLDKLDDHTFGSWNLSPQKSQKLVNKQFVFNLLISSLSFVTVIKTVQLNFLYLLQLKTVVSLCCSIVQFIEQLKVSHQTIHFNVEINSYSFVTIIKTVQLFFFFTSWNLWQLFPCTVLLIKLSNS